MLKRIAAVATMSAAIFLTSCQSHEEANANAEKVYDTVCTAEPLVYSLAYTVATAKEWSAKKISQLQQAHVVVVELCTNRPTDMISGLVTLTKAYQAVLDVKKQTEL